MAREILSETITNPRLSLSERLKERLQDKKEAPNPESAAQKLAQEIIADMPKEVALIRNGHPQIIAKLVGEGMRRSRKSVDPRLLRTALEVFLLPATTSDESSANNT
jgi:Asp-tRNA(Asn)/Glu-tRNA(Gln) amidotransferase B subunit